MDRASILVSALIVALASLLPGAEKRPNVVFVLTDDQRSDTISLNERSVVKTPNIDRLGNEGVYFRNAFCTTSLCSPSRASILSGLYAHSHCVLDNFTEYPNDLPSFPRALHDAGYATGYIGKYHMGEENDEKRPGFDYFVTHKGQGKYWDTEFNVDGERKVLPGYYTHVVTDLADKWIRKSAGCTARSKSWASSITRYSSSRPTMGCSTANMAWSISARCTSRAFACRWLFVIPD